MKRIQTPSGERVTGSSGSSLTLIGIDQQLPVVRTELSAQRALLVAYSPD